ncbi:hypothetical protein Geob_1531 [Geotalea daltonii FRC-32]|uniref:Uncharacterized protein n=1 Tax=Geotalea daltonii (strain DSM 22248 / JCM 15807 / FRC-32) TaxID=316067 RepID=B9M5D5_GEODF|nr:hypothetical protein [Geotalea daltonii]ACM19890.1 hypothetical protein Geob_1531 [Geotalea daltonii FRC-32]
MPDSELVHQTQMELDGDNYQILVFCRRDGRFFAQTLFEDDDIIISDGLSLLDALGKHERLLPLAVVSRQLKRYPFKSRTKRL